MTIARSERRNDPQSILLGGQKREVFALSGTYPFIEVLLKINRSIWHPLQEKNRPKAKAKDTVSSFPKTGKRHLLLPPATHFCPAATTGCYGPPLCIRPIRDKVTTELDRLENDGNLTKVNCSEWATPVDSVAKKDGSIRLCGDFKVSLSNQLKVDQCPLPRVDDVFASLAGGQRFTKIDLRQAYLQLEMEDESKEYLVLNTHKVSIDSNAWLLESPQHQPSGSARWISCCKDQTRTVSSTTSWLLESTMSTISPTSKQSCSDWKTLDFAPIARNALSCRTGSITVATRSARMVSTNASKSRRNPTSTRSSKRQPAQWRTQKGGLGGSPPRKFLDFKAYKHTLF